MPLLNTPSLRGCLWSSVLVAVLAAINVARVSAEEPATNQAQELHEPPLGVTPLRPSDVCGTVHPDLFRETMLRAIERGEIPNPQLQAHAPVRPRKPLAMGGGTQSLTPDDIFLYEDTEQLLLTNFSDGELFLFMGDASAALIEEHGDNFDFIAFFLNFDADHQIGAAFYLGLENLTDGLGLNAFIRRSQYGVPGDQTEGWVMMWNVWDWNPGDGGNANFTRLVLGQEFEHRWAMFLDPIVGNRPLQGDNGPCGRASHWNFRVDGQGSGMEIAEWTGDGPVSRSPGTLHYNTDIGGVFSATDLYLMGYLLPQEMDARNSELRYMDDANNCGSPYSGLIFDFNSSRIIQSNGPRDPSATESQHHFRTGWIMVHLPGDPPNSTEINRMLGILEQHQLDWYHSTLGIGTMSNSITETLGGDFDLDGDVDLDDYGAFENCRTGAEGGPYASGCEVFDDDLDGDVDLPDYSVFMRAFEGDCGVSFTTQPEDQTVCVNSSATITAEADGELFGYQWTHNGIPIPGATGSSYSVNPVTADNIGAYRVSAFGQCHTAHSAPGTLSIHPPATITQHPELTGACIGGTAELEVAAEGIEPLSYQWLLEGQNIPGATDATLMLTGVSQGDFGHYRCRVTDGCGVESVSNQALLVEAEDVTMTSQPFGGDYCEGNTIALFATAEGITEFQWYKDDVAIPGAIASFLFIPNATQSDSGTYHVEVTGPCNAVVSDDAVVVVNDCG